MASDPGTTKKITPKKKRGAICHFCATCNETWYADSLEHCLRCDMPTIVQSLTPHRDRAEDDEGTIYVRWNLGADTITLACFPSGKLMVVKSCAEPPIVTHVMELVNNGQ